MLIQVLQATRRVSVGASGAEGSCGPTALEQAAWLRQGAGPALSRDLCQVSLEVPSSLCNLTVCAGDWGGIFRISTDLDILFGVC